MYARNGLLWAISSVPRLRCHPEVTSDHPKFNAHGVFSDHNYRVWVLVPDGNSLIRGQPGPGTTPQPGPGTNQLCQTVIIAIENL